MSRLLIKAVFFLIIGICFGKSNVHGQKYALDVRIPNRPQSVMIDGKLWAYYELYLTNISSDTLHLKRIEINSPGSDSTIIEGNELTKKLAHNPGNALLPKSATVAYIEIARENSGQDILLDHRIFYQDDHGNATKIKIRLTVPRKNALTLAPPLMDGPWAAVYDPSWERGHRRVIFQIEKNKNIPGRFAIDFIRMNKNGQYAASESDSVKNWFGYGAPVLAVADGVIASVNNDFTESATVSAHPKYDSSKATGNYISLKLADNTFAFYEHLRPGSIKVRPGDQVKRGDIIASLGFTGQSTGPHLHFHVADRDSPLGANGLPFVFETFKKLGVYSNFADFGIKHWDNSKDPTLIKRERPAPNSVISF